MKTRNRASVKIEFVNQCSSSSSRNGPPEEKEKASSAGASTLTKVLVILVGVALSRPSFPSPPESSLWSTAFFYGKTMCQVTGACEEYGFPRDRDNMSPDPPKKNLVPLPNEIDASTYSGNPDGLIAKMRELNWPNEPIVFRKLGQDRPDIFGNLLDYNVSRLEQVYGDVEVNVFTHMTFTKSAVKMPFMEYTNNMKDKSRRLYARAIPDRFKVVAGNINDEALAKLMGLEAPYKRTKMIGRKHAAAQLFVGSNHVWSGAHCDIGTSAFFMIQGRKRWVFYGPNQTPYMYPRGQHRNVAFSAGIDVFQPNLEDSPLFAKARGYEVIIEPGDMLLFPSLWWHGVQNLDEQTVGVDVPVLDFLGSYHRNTALTVATVFNPFLWATSLSTYLSAGSMYDVFFAGYLMSDDKNNTQKNKRATRSRTRVVTTNYRVG